MSLLTGCGEKVGKLEYPPADAVPAIATSSIETEPAIHTDKPEGVILEVAESVEVCTKVTLNELFTNKNVSFENGNELIETNQLGKQEIKVLYLYDNEVYENIVEYTVTDTTPPVLLNSGAGAIAEAGEEFDLNNYVGFADNYDPIPTLTYEGTVDTSVCGTYPLFATATDSSGNATSWELSITVMEEIPIPEDNNERLYFSDFMEQYASENVQFGIDVSKWQGDIDFEAVKNAGCSFVIIRIGSYYDEYGHTLDDYYISNIEKAKEAGLDVGVYIYTTANTEEKVKADAKWIADTLEGTELDFPVVFDWESFSNFQQYEMSIHDLNGLFELFADEMGQYGYSAMLYSSKNFLNNFWYEHSEEYPIWLAHYTDWTDYTGEYSMWQMSCYGRIDGIENDVDLNILYTDKPM